MCRLFVHTLLILSCVCTNSVLSQDAEIRIDNTLSLKSLEDPTTFNILMQRPEVQRELELAGPQVRRIKLSHEKINELRAEFRSATRGITDRDEAVRLREALHSNMSTEIDVVKSELLPHQKERLEQIALQYHLAIINREKSSLPSISPMLSPSVVNGLQITDSQKQKIEIFYEQRDDEIRRLYTEYEKQIREIQLKSQKRILSVLTKNQQTETNEKLGLPADLFFAPDRVGAMLNKK